MSNTVCHCGSGKELSLCCEPIILGTTLARTPEELMRARFTAHCLQNYTFLVTSTHPEHREGATEADIQQWACHVAWKELEVHSATPGLTDNDGKVSFTAHYTVRDIPQELREDATFTKLDGEWKYVDGHVHKQEPDVREHPKTGRNEPCLCGSGKKYKKCCLGTEA